jgi:hypothetical protein
VQTGERREDEACGRRKRSASLVRARSRGFEFQGKSFEACQCGEVVARMGCFPRVKIDELSGRLAADEESSLGNAGNGTRVRSRYGRRGADPRPPINKSRTTTGGVPSSFQQISN